MAQHRQQCTTQFGVAYCTLWARCKCKLCGMNDIENFRHVRLVRNVNICSNNLNNPKCAKCEE